MSLQRSFLRNDGGQTIVESALSLTLLLGMLFGAMFGGLMLYTYHYLSFVARVGNRYAMVRGSACNPSGGMPDCPNVTSDQVQTYVRGFHYAGIDPNQLTVTVTWPNQVGTDPGNNPGEPVQVRASYPFTLSVPFVTLRTLTLHSTSQMVISQ